MGNAQSFKDIVDASPIAWLVGTAVASGGVVASAMGWILGARSERKLDEANAASAAATNALKAQLAAMTSAREADAITTKADLAGAERRREAEVAALKLQVDDREGRLKLIERELGGERAVIDVARLTLPPGGAVKLGEGYTAIADGLFYVDTIRDDRWTYEVLPEAALIRETMTTSAGALELPQAAEGTVIYAWRRDDVYEASARLVTDADQQLIWRVRPLCSVQFLSTALIEAALREQQAQSNREGDVPDAAQAKVADRLVRAMCDGYGLVFLQGQLMQSLGLPARVEGATHSIRTVQMAGNVLYGATEMRVSGDAGSRLVVEQDWTIVTTSRGAYIVASTLPSRDGLSSARGWMNAFLAGLRVPA